MSKNDLPRGDIMNPPPLGASMAFYSLDLQGLTLPVQRVVSETKYQVGQFDPPPPRF